MREAGATNGEGREGPVGLSDSQIEEIARLLRAGRRLPSYLVPHLFELPREYELAYAGKARRSDVLAETMAVPLQRARTFGVAPDAWSNMLVFGDNLQVLRRLLRMKEAGELRNADGSDGIRLCYIDPPFATRREFSGSKEELAYLDRVEGAEFVEALRQRLILIHELLATDGSLYVHLDSRKSHYMKVVLDEIFGEARFEREIIWRIGWVSGYKSGANNWIRNHDTILYYRRGDAKVFNKEYLAYPEGYTRRDGSEPSGRGIPIEDTWNCNAADRMDSIQIMSFSAEKTGFPTQKNRNLLERIISASSNPGDLVLDCFVGSGTAAVVAERLNRRWIAVDSGKYAVYMTQRELLRLPPEQRSGVGFAFYNAGLYDYEAVRGLDWDSYRRFVLDLFQCRDDPHSLGGVVFDGYLGDDSVLVYDFRDHPGASIGIAFAEDLRRLAGGGLGARCFIVSPAALVEPYEDYMEIEGTRVFFLRIPYSVIAEIHRRAFSELRQPSSPVLTNALVDSVGFDFIQPPSVSCSYVRGESTLDVVIDRFESQAVAGDTNGDSFEELAMVMVDANYSGEVFDVDLIYWAERLSEEGWTVSIPSAQVGERIMLVYLDVFGNEYREVKSPHEFVARWETAAEHQDSVAQ